MKPKKIFKKIILAYRAQQRWHLNPKKKIPTCYTQLTHTLPPCASQKYTLSCMTQRQNIYI